MDTRAPLCRQHGMTLLETVAALALASALSLALLSGLRPLSCALRVQAARQVLADALLEARRRAYAGEVTTSVKAGAGDGFVRMSWSEAPRALGDGITLSSGPADGDVQFRASGLADNATLALACTAASAASASSAGPAASASVVVNQRGVIR